MQVHKDLRDPLVQQVTEAVVVLQESRVQQEMLVLQDRLARMVIKDLKDLKVHLVQLVQKVHLVPQVQMELWAPEELLEPMVRRVHRDQMDLLEKQAHKDHKVQQVKKAI